MALSWTGSRLDNIKRRSFNADDLWCGGFRSISPTTSLYSCTGSCTGCSLEHCWSPRSAQWLKKQFIQSFVFEQTVSLLHWRVFCQIKSCEISCTYTLNTWSSSESLATGFLTQYSQSIGDRHVDEGESNTWSVGLVMTKWTPLVLAWLGSANHPQVTTVVVISNSKNIIRSTNHPKYWGKTCSYCQGFVTSPSHLNLTEHSPSQCRFMSWGAC